MQKSSETPYAVRLHCFFPWQTRVLTQEEPIDSATDKWKNIKKYLNLCDGIELNVFYRHFWLSKYNLSTNKKLVRNFNEMIPKTIYYYNNFLDELEKNAKYYAMIVSPKESEWKQPENLFVYTCLSGFKIFKVTQIRIFLMALFDVKERKLITFSVYKKILLFLEHYHFIFTAVCSSRPSGLERRYSLYARRLRKCEDKKSTKCCIEELIDDLSDNVPSYEEFEEKIKKITYTSNEEKDKKLVQYILRKLEKYYSTEELKPQSFTIEHILSESTKNVYVGQIGNLLPLGANINNDLGNESFSKKLKGYSKSQYKTVDEFVKNHGNIVARMSRQKSINFLMNQAAAFAASSSMAG